MKILINTPAMSLNSGGVANHYYGLLPYWSEKIKYNIVGKRKLKSGTGFYWFIWDIIKYSFLLIFWRPDAVVLNPSIQKNALKRDFLFMRVGRFFNRKVIVFIHGFHPEYCETIDTKKLAQDLSLAKGIFVLAESYKTLLLKWGVKCPVVTTTTKVDDRLISNFNINKRIGQVNNILFLSRVEKEKGIYETIDAFSILKKKYKDLSLTVVGQGTKFESARQYVNDKEIKDVLFTGRLQGDGLIEQYKKADIYCFPSYSEGMPTSVLEAMAFGLPIVTRNVGGLVDFFEQGKMGFITDSFSAQDFAEAVSNYKENAEYTKETSLFNYQYATEHFLASKVAAKFEKNVKQLIE